MEMILAGDHPDLQVLRKQFANASVQSREFTGSGFFAHFSIPENSRRIDRSLTISDTNGHIRGGTDPVGFILFVNDGLIDTLECHTWVDDVSA